MAINHAEFVEQAESLTDQLRVLIEQMPSKGLVEEDCQKLCLINRLNDLEYTINGTTDEDFDDS